MKKLFLIPLMTLVTCVMAWGYSTHSVGTFTELQTALSGAADGDVIKFTQDITYGGAWKTVNSTDLNSASTVEPALCITKSLTLDGNGHKLIGWGKHDIAIGATNGVLNCYPTSTAATLPAKTNINTIHRVTLAVHPDDPNAEIIVTIKNLSIGNTTMNKRYYGVMAFDGVKKMAWDNVKVECGEYSAQQALCTTGANSTPIELAIENSEIIVGTSGYATYFLKPITGHFTNTSILGWSALYFKNRNIQVYGAVVGTRGSNFTCNACTFTCRNIHNGESNSFAMFPMEDDGITLTLNNCSLNAEQIGDQAQSIVSLQAATRTSGYQPVVVNISGDNTHMYNIGAEAFKNNFAIGSGAYRDVITGEKGGNGEAMNVALTINISGGTFSENPESLSYPVYGGTTTTPTIVSGYEVQEVKQGTKTLYRVVKKAEEKAPGVKYDLNDDVPSDPVEGAGDNPNSSFELSTGTTMELNQATTEAGYVQVKDNGSDATTVKVGKTDGEDNKINQTLVINNGLDVQGESQVIVQAGSALVIGEGGITTEDPENIVIEADEDGAASLLLEPSITVNQTPELTVKMTATTGIDGYGGRVWHRFALPVDRLDAAWEKTRTGEGTGTYLYGWNYSSHDWAPLAGGSTDMTQWNGYTLSEWSTSAELFEVTYTFKGHLAGNMDAALNFVSGYNFFGNSYTGYISAANMLSGIADGNVQGTVWMWEPENQTYGAAALSELLEHPDRLEPWQKEVAPMQTFILRLAYGSAGSASINYADAIWGNPRYGNTSTPAPKRRALRSNSVSDDAYMRIVVTAANGKSDYVTFTENSSLSDAYDDNYDAEKFMNVNHFNFYATVSGADYTCVATNSLVGKKMSLSTLNDVNYTMSFKFVEGTRYAVKDNVTGEITDIEEGNTYSFTAQPNAVIDGRFEIVGRSMVVTGVEETELKSDVKGIYTMLGQYVGDDFNALPKGVYIVNGVKVVK